MANEILPKLAKAAAVSSAGAAVAGVAVALVSPASPAAIPLMGAAAALGVTSAISGAADQSQHRAEPKKVPT